MLDSLGNSNSDADPSDSDSDQFQLSDQIATIGNTFRTTAILEAGRLSLDLNKCIDVKYDENDRCKPIELCPR